MARVRHAMGHWQERCEVAEQQCAALGRHLRALAEVIHGHNGGVVNRYYETSALRFILGKEAPALVGRESGVPQWLRTQAEFLHALAESAIGVGTDPSMRKRIDGIRAAPPVEMSVYEAMAALPPAATVTRRAADSHPGADEALASLDHVALRYLVQVTAALAFGARLGPVGEFDHRAIMQCIERLADAAEQFVKPPLRQGSGRLRMAAVAHAGDLIQEALESPWLRDAPIRRPLPSIDQVADLHAAANGTPAGIGNAAQGPS